MGYKGDAILELIATGGTAAVAGKTFDLSGLSGTFSIKTVFESKPFNVLSGTFSGADIYGLIGSTPVDVAADTFTGSTISYTSDYYTFQPGQNLSFQFGLLNARTSVKDGVLQPFAGVPTGSFAESATPEPASWALMMVGVGGMGAALRTRRRKVAA